MSNETTHFNISLFYLFSNHLVRSYVPKYVKDIDLTFANTILLLKLPENMFL